MSYSAILLTSTSNETIVAILEAAAEWLQNWVSEIFNFLNLQNWGIKVWNFAMSLIGATATTSPQDFSTHAWNYVVNDVLDFTMFVGGSLLNVFFLVGMLRQSTNLKENYTLETFVDNVIKMLLANLLILNGVDLIKLIFDLCGISARVFLIDNTPSIEQIKDGNVMDVIFNYLFIGILFFIVSLVCSVTIFITVYQRYLTLYILVATYPIAMSTLPAGPGVFNTASSWTRTFLSKSFEIVVIAMAISIASYMCQSIDFGTMNGGEYNSTVQAFQSMATMIILAGAVKGVDQFMQRAFHL